MTIALTRDLGKFVSSVRYQDIPEAAISAIHTAFTDSVGVMVAGAAEPALQLLKAMLAPVGSEAMLAVGKGRASALDAAWINGTAAHALDFDDVAQRGGHTSAVLVPAILAEAETVGASGERMVCAFAAGYETIAELARRDDDHHHDKGWHPMGILGAIGAAAACASLRALDPEKAAAAIALGASQSSGLMSNLGTMAKPFHAGRAAHAGVASARLADLGFTASLDALEHPPGFLMAVSHKGRIDLDTPVTAGIEWQICGDNRLAVKKYPLCYCTHRAIDGMLDMCKLHNLDAGQVQRVTVSISRRNTGILRNHAPQTGLEAKFSMEFAMTSALIARRAGLAELTDGFLHQPEVQLLMKRVTVVPVDSEDPQRPGYAKHDQVVVETRDGRRFDSGPVTNVRGDQEQPLQREELWTKFEECIRAGNPGLPARKLFDILMSLDRLAHVRELVGVMSS